MEMLVVMVMVSALSLMGANMLVSLNRGMKGTQDRADFVQMQSMGTELLMASPSNFCKKAGIIGLRLPSTDY